MATTAQFVTDDLGKKILTVTFTAANDAVVFQPKRPLALSIQSLGAFTSATIDIQASNDGATYYALPTAVSLSALGIKDVASIDLGFAFYRVIMLAASEAHTAVLSWFENN